ncbi:MAG TPA: hypothetical protein VE871_19135 [Longimicrobium sp.]|nr:hypothetical protein [Longimicrobium sp.]
MLRLSSHGHTARALAVGALFAAAACSDGAGSPTGTPAANAAAPSASHAAGHLKHGKYRDTGLPHATGRSGSATLSASAIIGSDGITRLRVTSGSIHYPGQARGELAKVQVKVWTEDGEKILTQNFQRPTPGATVDLRFPGIPAGARFQVQANVRGIDGKRTDVVTVTETGRLGAAFSTTIHLPDQVVVGVPTIVTATVREINGQTGGTTACVLFVDGREVDRVNDVWVDAGDQVSCAFTYTFSSAGDHDVRVGLVNVDSDPGLLPPPPSSSGVVNAADPNLPPRWTASVLDRTVQTEIRFDAAWWKPDGSHREYERNTGESPRSQTINMTVSLDRATDFPVDARLALSSNVAGTFQSESWSQLTAGAPDANGQACLSQSLVAQGGIFTLCSTGSGLDGSTTFGYTRFAGTVTYHSRGFVRQWDNLTGTETGWSWNDSPEYYGGGGQMRRLGTSVGMALGIVDGAGDYEVNATVPLSTFDRLLSEVPYTCRVDAWYWLDGGAETTCEGRTEREIGWSGTATG